MKIEESKIQLFSNLTDKEKIRYRAEASLLFPEIVNSKYANAAMYLLTYYGILCHNIRDQFTAGSVSRDASRANKEIAIKQALILIQEEIKEAAERLDETLFQKYWKESKPKNPIQEWLKKADALANNWVPSDDLFKNF